MDTKPSVAPPKAKDFLTENNWCRNAMARAADGSIVSVRSNEAVKFCVIGVIEKLYPTYGEQREIFDRIYEARVFLDHPIRHLSLASINDICGYKVVKQLLERADV